MVSSRCRRYSLPYRLAVNGFPVFKKIKRKIFLQNYFFSFFVCTFVRIGTATGYPYIKNFGVSPIDRAVDCFFSHFRQKNRQRWRACGSFSAYFQIIRVNSYYSALLRLYRLISRLFRRSFASWGGCHVAVCFKTLAAPVPAACCRFSPWGG